MEGIVFPPFILIKKQIIVLNNIVGLIKRVLLPKFNNIIMGKRGKGQVDGSKIIENIANAVFNSSLKMTNTTIEELIEIRKRKNISPIFEELNNFLIFQEYSFLLVFLITDMIFNGLSQKRKLEISEYIMLEISELVAKAYQEKKHEILNACLKTMYEEEYPESSQKYSKGLDTIKNEDYFEGNDLFTILGKEIARINDISSNKEFVAKVREIASIEFFSIDFEEFTKGFKM